MGVCGLASSTIHQHRFGNTYIQRGWDDGLNTSFQARYSPVVDSVGRAPTLLLFYVDALLRCCAYAPTAPHRSTAALRGVCKGGQQCCHHRVTAALVVDYGGAVLGIQLDAAMPCPPPECSSVVGLILRG